MTNSPKSVRKRYKLPIQALALALTFIAALPIYLGLQQDVALLTWVGLATVTIGMGIGLWGS